MYKKVLYKTINLIKFYILNLFYHLGANNIVTLGNPKYGAWTVSSKNLSKESIVYSFGVGEDISFDLELSGLFKPSTYLFDPTPRSIKWINEQSLPNNIKFFSWGLGAQNKVLDFYPPENPLHVSYSEINKNSQEIEPIKLQVNSLATIMKKLGHKKIDILKMDIEGFEYDVIENILDEQIPIKQILVEFHDRFYKNNEKSSRSSIKLLRNSGYKLFHISKNGEELSFIKS